MAKKTLFYSLHHARANKVAKGPEDTKDLVSLRLAVPTVGSVMVTTQPWTFRLWHERRNKKIWMAMTGKPVSWGAKDEFVNVTLPANSVLKVGRVYIRSHFREFDSITFSCLRCEDKRLQSRFWARLSDVNGMAVWPVEADGLDLKADIFNSFGEPGKRFLRLD